MTPWLDDPDVTLYHGDCLNVLRELPDRSVHMCATSPPFYGLRDYGTGEWEGGEADCDHLAPLLGGRKSSGLNAKRDDSGHLAEDSHSHPAQKQYGATCGKCGARRVDQQIGLEETPDQWVERLVAVFREVRRVLRDDGTLWVEIGDSFNSGTSARRKVSDVHDSRSQYAEDSGAERINAPGMKTKDLLGQPWLLAFALRADGWYLRSEIIWARPNPMPESVTDRPTKSHSTVFLLSKKPRYYYDQDAIRDPVAPSQIGRVRSDPVGGKSWQERNQHSNGGTYRLGAKDTETTCPVCDLRIPDDGQIAWGVAVCECEELLDLGGVADQVTTLDGGLASEADERGAVEALTDELLNSREAGSSLGLIGSTDVDDKAEVCAEPGVLVSSHTPMIQDTVSNASGPNARSVWQIPTEPTPFAHFATWPQALVRRMILAGTSERGCCPECGAPWVRDVDATKYEPEVVAAGVRNVDESRGDKVRKLSGAEFNKQVRRTTLGWSPSCAHDRQPVPCTVLDPFAGSGTTSLVARNHGRHSIGIELNESYLEIAAKRLQQLSLLA